MTDTKKDATKKAWATVTIANDDFVLLFVVALVRLIVIPRIFILFYLNDVSRFFFNSLKSQNSFKREYILFRVSNLYVYRVISN